MPRIATGSFGHGELGLYIKISTSASIASLGLWAFRLWFLFNSLILKTCLSIFIVYYGFNLMSTIRVFLTFTIANSDATKNPFENSKKAITSKLNIIFAELSILYYLSYQFSYIFSYYSIFYKKCKSIELL